MPTWVQKIGYAATAAEEAPTVITAPLAGPQIDRRCELNQYEKRSIPSVSVRSEIIAYASPDSTYAVTKKLFDAAKKSILIGIYDFSAPHIRQLVLDAMVRGVKVSLMLDIDGKDESRIFDDLVNMGVRGVPAPSCANERVRVFASSHEKVIVIDDEWTLVQSGNYSNNSIPLNEVDGGDGPAFRTGNRDTGLAIRSKELAKLFTDILESDMARVTAEPEALLEVVPEESAFLVERAPTRRPSRLFPSQRFNLEASVRIHPVFTPDNYLTVVPRLIQTATKSIFIEQQYIKANQTKVRLLLESIAHARREHPALKVRIILGKVFSRGDLVKERENLAKLDEDFDLKLDKNIRYVNTDRLVHCHNKMIIVDGAAVLVSSQNWSDFAVTRNREAGLWIPHGDIAQYFEAIFDVDWRTAFKSPEEMFDDTAVTPETLSDGGFIRVERADYEEV
jgi:phosphatidylserine/phosphatidylglycerophosphate/cardiolipin synthase-like enzyme